ncbi:MAG: mercuric reductase [Vicinamibacterales bacterium]
MPSQSKGAGGRYDLVVLGGGTAGLVSAIGAAGLGARVALIERDRLGGDCLNTGCVPSKALIRSARAAADVRRAHRFGVTSGSPTVEFTAVMSRMRERRAVLAVHDSAARLREAGVDVYAGHGRFVDPDHVEVAGSRLAFRRAVVATGGRPTAPPIPGLEESGYFTNENIFDLERLPARLLVIGAGPIGCELAQTFARFGSCVTVFDQARQVLPREDHRAAALAARGLMADGVQLELGVRLDRVQSRGNELCLNFSRRDGAEPGEVRGDAILVAAGRAPNVEGLELTAAGIKADRAGVHTDDFLRTTNRRVYAAGDVCTHVKFTHAADAMARIVVANALFFGRRRVSRLVIPWCTFTDPEVAHVGIAADAVARSNGRVATVTVDFGRIDRAVLDDDGPGFLVIHHQRGRIRGATIAGPHAGELIGEVAHAISGRTSLTAFSNFIRPYPTYGDALRRAGDAYRRQALTPRVTSLLARYFQWTR